MTGFYYLVLNKFQLVKNNAIEEILRERAHYYLSENKMRDFWLIENPEFLYTKDFMEKIKSTQFYNSSKKLSQLNQFYAIVSSDKSFINWLALRIGYFENLSQKQGQIKAKNYASTGLSGQLESIERNALIALPLHFKALKVN